MSKPVPIELRIPPQDGAPFTRFATTLAGAAGWCDALPMADPPGVAQRLRDTLLELNRAPLDPELRYELLETLRPSLTQTLTLLDRMLINQPLAMPPRMQALAAVSDQIGGLACTAYSICVMHAAREPARITRRAPARLVCEALERSLHYAAHKVLLALNLQLPIESRTWSTLHQLYLLGERYRLTDLAVPAATGGESTLRNTWLLPQLLACCHTGQLLRSDINVLHAALRHSAPRCTVKLASEPGLFAVDLGGASPPVYRASMATLGKQVRVLDTTEMLKPLTQASAMARKANRNGVLLGDTRIPLPVLEHLLDCLGSERERGSRRVIVREPLQAVLGFSAAHFHLAGERTLDELVQKPGARKAKPNTENPFLAERKSDDPWSAAPDTDRNHSSLNRDGSINVLARARTEKTAAPELPAGFSVLQVTTVDASPGGYCLDWGATAPAAVRNGELVCLRRDQKDPWLLGVVRWTHRQHTRGTTTGIEVLASRAESWACQTLRDGASQASSLRIIILPPNRLSQGRETIITPRSGFAPGNHLLLQRGQEQRTITLGKQMAISAGMNQFEVREGLLAVEDTATAVKQLNDIDYAP